MLGDALSWIQMREETEIKIIADGYLIGPICFGVHSRPIRLNGAKEWNSSHRNFQAHRIAGENCRNDRAGFVSINFMKKRNVVGEVDGADVRDHRTPTASSGRQHTRADSDGGSHG